MEQLLALLHRSNYPWLHWWQEVAINWLSSCSNIGTITVSSRDGADGCCWEPSDDTRERLERLLHDP